MHANFDSTALPGHATIDRQCGSTIYSTILSDTIRCKPYTQPRTCISGSRSGTHDTGSQGMASTSYAPMYDRASRDRARLCGSCVLPAAHHRTQLGVETTTAPKMGFKLQEHNAYIRVRRTRADGRGPSEPPTWATLSVQNLYTKTRQRSPKHPKLHTVSRNYGTILVRKVKCRTRF